MTEPLSSHRSSPYAMRLRPRLLRTPSAEQPIPPPPRPFGRTGTTVFLAAAYRRSQMSLGSPSSPAPASIRPLGRPVLTRLSSIGSGMESPYVPSTPLTPEGTPRALPFVSPQSGIARFPMSAGSIGSAGTPTVGASAQPPTIVVSVPPRPEPRGLEWWGSLLSGSGARARVDATGVDDEAQEVAQRAATAIQKVARGRKTRATIMQFMEDNYAGWEKLVDEPQVHAAAGATTFEKLSHPAGQMMSGGYVTPSPTGCRSLSLPTLSVSLV